MPPRPKRPADQCSPSSHSSSDSDDEPQSKRRRSSPVATASIKPIRVYIVDAKLDPEASRSLRDIVENSGNRWGTSVARMELCSSIAHSDVIVTGIRMRKRLARHLDWRTAQHQAIVTPSWLQESVSQGRILPCGDFAALSDLHDETVEHGPDNTEKASPDGSPADILPSIRPTDPAVFDNWKSRYACTRASPLTCPNQGLVDELNILHRDRELEGLSVNALAYQRAIAILKSYPFSITKQTYARDIIRLPGFGEKMLSKVQEYMTNGFISESRGHLDDQLESYMTEDERPSNARKFYDMGFRTFEDLERYHDVPPGADITSLNPAAIYTPDGRVVPSSVSSGKPPSLSVKVALVLREEFEVKIPRDEVDEMYRAVMGELHHIRPGCIGTIVGGYRRGKTESNDVDIVITHPALKNGGDLVKGLSTQLTERLYERGLVTHVMHLSGFHAQDALRTKNWDSLEKALTVFILPPPLRDNSDQQNIKPRLHRRLDLIFASPEAYWTAVIGWSGSKMFERDLRLWAKQEKGMKFDSSGLTRRRDSKLYRPRSEEEVFELLGLKWIDPTMRNADA